MDTQSLKDRIYSIRNKIARTIFIVLMESACQIGNPFGSSPSKGIRGVVFNLRVKTSHLLFRVGNIMPKHWTRRPILK